MRSKAKYKVGDDVRDKFSNKWGTKLESKYKWQTIDMEKEEVGDTVKDLKA